MNNIEKYSSINIMGLWSPFYECVYRGMTYHLLYKSQLFIISKEKIKDISKKQEWDFYATEVSVEELEAVYECQMFAIYNGKKYKVLIAHKNMESLVLIANENEDTSVGWDINIRDDLITKLVDKSEIEDIIVEKQDAYNYFLERL